MRAVIQRVTQAKVSVADEVVGSIGAGLLVFLGVHKDDTTREADYLADKILGLRIFPDGSNKLNLSVVDTLGEVLVISQFTLLADTRRGRRPSFSEAAPPELAKDLYEYFVALMRKSLTVATGRFQAMMEVELLNSGPVTLIIDTPQNQEKFKPIRA
ncbi:MAG: D-tyrosyl-tRNA(Tyr) deacylase [Deltaproteobacteria bacterium]|jgi:D-tyrosyl-tRNA(Tyr) deacylase|nr:D-tyrosyl-tRNA(Tyr) deacylase [Deltaproteobacteria bacterium]